MAIAYRSSGTFTEANSTSSGSIGLPAGLANGDILILVCQSRGTGGTVATPSGYTSAASVNITASHRLTVFYKYVTNAAGEVAPSVTQTVSGAIRCRLSAFSGGHATTQLDVAAVTDKRTSNASFDAPSITPVSTGSMVCWIFSSGDDNTLNGHSQGSVAFSSDGTAGTDGSIALVYELQTSAAASGTCSMTQSANGPDNWNVITLALRPAAVAPTNPSTALFDGILFDVDVAFGYGPFSPEPVWTRVTDYLKRDEPITITSGRQSEDSDAQPGTLSLCLLNSITGDAGRRFDPDYTDGPYYGELNVRTPIRVWSRRDGVNHYHFTGHVQSWRQVNVGGSRDNYTVVTAVDLMAILANEPTPSTALQLAVLADEPEVYLPMDEEVVPATIVDRSGNAWSGRYPSDITVVDSPLPGEASRKAKARSLVGVTGFDGTIASMTASTTPENVRTLEAWVKITAYDLATTTATGLTFPITITAYGVSNGLRLTAFAEITAGAFNPYWQGRALDSTGAATTGWTAPWSPNRLSHLAVVLADTDEDVSVYLDGQLIGRGDSSPGSFEGGALTPGLFVMISADESAATVAHVAVYQEALSAERIIAHYNAGLVSGHLEPAADRMATLASLVGIDDANLYDGSDLGAHTFLAATEFSGSVLDEMRTIMRAEQGRLFVNGQGVLTAQSRVLDLGPAAATHVESQGTFGDDPTSELRYEEFHREPATPDLLRNIVTINGVELRDLDSVRLYGHRSEDLTLPIASPGAARAIGQSRLRRFSTPQPRINQLRVNLRGHLDAELDDVLDLMLALELGWRLTATIRPADGLGNDTTEDVRVEGRNDEITRDTWITDLYLVPAGESYTEAPWFVIGDATYGRIGAAAGNQIPA